jgi:GNAT superfamily N-acetyltransferase
MGAWARGWPPTTILEHVRQTERVVTNQDASSSGAEPIVVRPATIERFDDIEPVINPACWCQWWRQTAAEYGRSAKGDPRSNSEAHRATLRDQCGVGPVPGVVAYVGDVPVGWCGFGPRSSMRRLERSRTIPKVDDLPVWSVVCFNVRAGYRRRGIAKALLGAAVDYARMQGAVGMEAYPTDPAGTRRNTTFSYTGFTTMFEAVGFRRVVETASHADRLPRWLMRLDFERTTAVGGTTTPDGAPIPGR